MPTACNGTLGVLSVVSRNVPLRPALASLYVQEASAARAGEVLRTNLQHIDTHSPTSSHLSSVQCAIIKHSHHACRVLLRGKRTVLELSSIMNR